MGVNVQNLLLGYQERRDAAVAAALKSGLIDDKVVHASFEVGQGQAHVYRRARTPVHRGTVNWKTRMAERQGATGRTGRGHNRGPVGQQAPGQTHLQVGPGEGGYPVNDCPIDAASSMPTGMGCEDVPPCGVNVIGGTTLGTPGIAPGATGPLVITAGDAGYFQPRAIYWEALPRSTDDLVDISLLPSGCCVLPSILVDAAIGRVSVLRRGGSPDRGLIQGGFANTKELVAVDWGEFVSTNEQNLTLFFYNLVAGIDVHVCVDLWGNI